jgi:hypothetical protein
MPSDDASRSDDNNRVSRASFYFIQGEDAAREGRKPSECRYIRGAIAWREWMIGYGVGMVDLPSFDTPPDQ